MQNWVHLQTKNACFYSNRLPLACLAMSCNHQEPVFCRGKIHLFFHLDAFLVNFEWKFFFSLAIYSPFQTTASEVWLKRSGIVRSDFDNEVYSVLAPMAEKLFPTTNLERTIAALLVQKSLDQKLQGCLPASKPRLLAKWPFLCVHSETCQFISWGWGVPW